MAALYRFDPATGEEQITQEGVALLLGVSPAELAAHVAVHGHGAANLPAEWTRRGNLRRAEYSAATGDMSITGALDHYANTTD